MMSSTQRPSIQHKRAKSASVLKGIISSKSSKSLCGDVKSSTQQKNPPLRSQGESSSAFSRLLPADHPHSYRQQNALCEIHNQSTNASPPKFKHATRHGPGAQMSTAQTPNDMKQTQSRDTEKSADLSRRGKDKPSQPKKSKSATNLAGLFRNNRSSKDLSAQNHKSAKEKENTTPPGSSWTTAPPTPIWSQFATQQTNPQECSTTSKIPLNDAQSRAEEIERYTPKNRDNARRDYFGEEVPVLSRKTARPKSVELATATAKSLFHPIMRKNSQSRKISSEEKKKQAFSAQSSIATHKREVQVPVSPSKGFRVMAAVASLDGRAKEAEIEAKLDPKKIDAAFEAVLDSRNIPEPMRQKMRSLKTAVKADFIRSHAVNWPRGSADTDEQQCVSNETPADSSRLLIGTRSVQANLDVENKDADDEAEAATKRSRPRSRTFTFNKSETSPSKKHKSDARSSSRKRAKSREPSTDGRLPRSQSSSSISSLANAGGKSSKSGGVVPPGDFVRYLHDKTSPQEVEVGRLHKLRLLLRNETVTWVNTFISEGGMAEILALLSRVMAVEWREDHEDALLHETLLCLKGLTTTDLALKKLNEVSETLFPDLLGMLFDKEHKGPSEFTTRQIVVNIIFAHLSNASPTALANRARTVLSYLQDRSSPDMNQTLPFVMNMRQPRPYRTWNKEVVNVTKEVFWIFLHQLNVISLSQQDDANNSEPKPVEATPPLATALAHRTGDCNAARISTTSTSRPHTPARPTSSRAEAAGYARSEDASYTTRHFPPPRPPVPVAPYVGGVEWDATNYLAAHLDLLNGLVSALPTIEERNELRALLKASGWEKIMGATLRTCKEKFYSAVHAGLRTWVAAASEDGWAVADVRFGPREEDAVTKSVRSSPVKKKNGEAAPKLDIPLMTELAPLAFSDDAPGKELGGSGAQGDAWTFEL